MRKSILLLISILHIIVLLSISFKSTAQFKEKAFSQNYNSPNDSTARDSVETLFSFKEYFQGLKEKKNKDIGLIFTGSTLFIGGEQIYNKDYWKLPIIYGSLATTTGLGIYFNHKANITNDSKYRTISTSMFVGTGLIYWATLLDGVISYKAEKKPDASKATLYSILLPGMGQAYNGEYWKIPIYYACLIGAAHFAYTNNINYQRFKRIYNEISLGGTSENINITSEQAVFYRNAYRRLRDYSIVTLVGFYIFQIIDANVFSYMQDFDMSDNISLSLAPSIIQQERPENISKFNPLANNIQVYGLQNQVSAIGIKFGIRF